ncbi:neprilysin-4-like [Musca vetustissima]|uniref:neprilysin-4-like n=1 Tax=Musca vetustissima TaxID=27455 RepID=UPI002AB754CC|nr:neprilysin-4-like [Musca vetustissima]
MSVDHEVQPCDNFYAYSCNNWIEHHSNLRQHHRGIEDYRPESDWSHGDFDLFALLGKLQSYGLNNLLIYQEVSRGSGGSVQIIFEKPRLDMAENSQDEEANTEFTLFYYFLKRSGMPAQQAQGYMKKLKRTQQHWHQVYRNYSIAEDAENPVRTLTFEKLQQLFPKLARFLENLLDTPLAVDTMVAIYNLEYFQYLVERQLSAENSQNLCNYLMMKFLVYLFKDATDDFTKQQCLRDLRNKMDVAVNYLYHQYIIKHEVAEYYDDVAYILHKIYEYFMQTLEENSLNLIEPQMQLLKLKLNTLRVNFGNLPQQIIYPQYGSNNANNKPQLNPQEIENFYHNLPQMDPHSYYRNHLALLKHRFWRTQLYEPSYSFYIATDNTIGSSSTPIYYARQNMVILFPGFLQDPIYNLRMDPLSKWSLLAFILAHEFTHAIDTSGMYFDPDGSLRQSDLGIQDAKNFTQSLECLQQQLATDTIDERLADLMGARVVFNAYIKEYNWTTGSDDTSVDWRRLFFINMSQFFCGAQGIQFRDHDSDADRVHQIVMNIPAFAEAFECGTGSKMNPAKKCRVF